MSKQRPSPEYERAANKKYLDAKPGRRKAKQDAALPRKKAEQAAFRRLAKRYPGVFKSFYDEECIARDVPVRGRGRPKAAA